MSDISELQVVDRLNLNSVTRILRTARQTINALSQLKGLYFVVIRSEWTHLSLSCPQDLFPIRVLDSFVLGLDLGWVMLLSSGSLMMFPQPSTTMSFVVTIDL